jgi:hypothetical protein
MTYEQAAWSWTQHLRRGGSTPWRDWQRGWQPDPDVSVPSDWTVPGAAQLELVRRLADRGGALRGFTALADLVLSRSGPGRGLAQQPLSWSDGGAPTFGPPPVDPVDVPVDELLRLGVGVLVEQLLHAPTPKSDRSIVRRWPLTRSPSFALGGAPVTTAAVRRELNAAGHAEGGRSPQVLLFAEPFDRALAQAWSVRVQQGSSARWRGFVDRWAARGELPPSTDIPRLAGQWVDRVGRDAVHVVAAPSSMAAAASTATDLLGLGRRSGQRLHPKWSDLEPGAVDLLRRLNGVLGVRADRDERAAAVRTFVRFFDDTEPAGHARLGVPARHLAWARATAERMADDLAAGGYPVHGRLEELVPGTGEPRPHRRDVLRVVIWACLQQTVAMHHGAPDGADQGKAAT